MLAVLTIKLSKSVCIDCSQPRYTRPGWFLQHCRLHRYRGELFQRIQVTTPLFPGVHVNCGSQSFNINRTSQLVIGPNTPASKQGVILHDAPAAPSTSLINTLVGTEGIRLLYITDDIQANDGNPYDSLPSQFGVNSSDPE